jgi:signal recognition particle receptor subunit beta
VVLVDTRRLADSFAAIDFFEDRGLPYIVGLNCFDGLLQHRVEDVREAMSIDTTIPIVSCDARNRESTKQTLITLVEHAMHHRMIAGAR